jgi:hypothetical protein
MADEQITAKPPVPVPTDAIVAKDARVVVGHQSPADPHFDSFPDITLPNASHETSHPIRLAIIFSFILGIAVYSGLRGVHFESITFLFCFMASMAAFFAKRFIYARRKPLPAPAPSRQVEDHCEGIADRKASTTSPSEAIRE